MKYQDYLKASMSKKDAEQTQKKSEKKGLAGLLNAIAVVCADRVNSTDSVNF
jgi:hypothetical protein